MRYLDLFTGIGGFTLGIEQAYEDISNSSGKKQRRFPRCSSNNECKRLGQEQPTCIGFSEIDKYASAIYQKHYPEHKNYGDITKIDTKDLPEFDLLVGGFPCQAFSIAGKRKGFGDTRGTLIYDVLRIAKAKEPMFLLLENVKGLVSHDGGKTLEVILESLQELGYYVNYEIRNSKDYGVPQNRERIFFLCRHIKGLTSVGQSEKITTSESIIQEWLFQLLLNNLAEVKKLQGHASKDWVVGYLLLKEISQNPEWNAENILAGISTNSDEKSSPLAGYPWLNIVMWLSDNLGANFSELNKSTTLTAINEIIGSKTYTYSQMLKAILLATVLLRDSSKSLWDEVLSSLIVIQEDTKYARINNKNEKAIITESGTLHLSNELQDFREHFIVGHLRGTSRPQVFPITDGNPKGLEELTSGASQGYRVYGENGVNPTLASEAGGVGAKTGLVCPTIRATQHKGGDNQTLVVKIPEATVGQSINLSVPNSKTRRGRVSDVAQTLDTGMQQHTLTSEMKIRRLTPTECARLQGFPDDWHKIEGISDTQAYKCYGNAVTVNVVGEVMKRILTSSL